MGKSLRKIIIGGVIGATLGVLYAPRAGKKTREIIAEKTESLWGEEAQNQGTIIGEVAKTTKSAINATKNVCSEVIGAKTDKIQNPENETSANNKEYIEDKASDFSESNVTPVFSEKNDELRERIENARVEISGKVKENLNDHKKTAEAKANMEDASKDCKDTKDSKDTK